MKTPRTLACASVLAAFALACGEDEGQLDNPENVKTWATTASALGVYANIYAPVAFADGHATFGDPECPVTGDDGGTVTIVGGCTDAMGAEWVGSATIEQADDGDRSVTLEDYGSFTDPEQRSTARGHAEIDAVEANVHEFNVDLALKGGVTTSIIYHGRVEGDYGARTVWSGNGRVKRAGSVEPTGVVTATTIAEVSDNEQCSGQPASGQTTLKLGDQVAVVTYDGASDCDSDANARWSVDGEDRGALSGIACSSARIGNSSQSGSAVLAAFIVLGAALMKRRRHQPSS